MSNVEREVFNQIVSVLQSLYKSDLVGVIFYRLGMTFPQKYGLIIITKKLKTTMPMEEFVIVSQTLKAHRVWIPIESTFISVMTLDNLKRSRNSPIWREVKEGLIGIFDPEGIIKRTLNI